MTKINWNNILTFFSEITDKIFQLPIPPFFQIILFILAIMILIALPLAIFFSLKKLIPMAFGKEGKLLIYADKIKTKFKKCKNKKQYIQK